jgi:hypothetical protein
MNPDVQLRRPTTPKYEFSQTYRPWQKAWHATRQQPAQREQKLTDQFLDKFEKPISHRSYFFK